MTVGSEISKARISSGLSTEELAKRTLIREATLRKLEKDQLENLGAEVYVVGWLRSCAKALGLDADSLVHQYRNQVAQASELEELADSSPQQRNLITNEEVAKLPVGRVPVLERRAPRDRPNWSLALAGVFAGLLVIAGLAVVGRLVVGDGSSPQVVVASPTEAESLVVESDDFTSDDSGVEDEGLLAALPGAPVEVTLRVEGGRSWVRVTDIEDVELFEGILSDGDERRFTDNTRLDVVVGNAGVVAIIHNGVDLGTVGQAGQVIKLEFDATINIG